MGSPHEQHLQRSSLTIKCTTFSDPKLRRGIRVSKVLGHFGAILGDRAGSSDTFALRHVMSLTLVAVACSGALVVGGVLPVIENGGYWSYPVTAPYNTTICYVVPMLALLCGHGLMDVLKHCGVTEPRAFLDKACIHQTDAALQREGIESLSAYLSVSDEMVIVYTSTYLKRLWTVYELASMLMMKSEPRITVVTTHLTQLLYIWWTLFFLFVLGQIFVGTRAAQQFITVFGPAWVQHVGWYGAMLPVMMIFVFHVRRWAKERQNMHVAARAFRIRSAVCCVDDDRKKVHKNIASFMRDFGFVPQTATVDQALDAFDLVAQKLVPLHLDTSFGALGLSYSHSTAMMLPLMGWGLDIIFSNATQGFAVQWYMANFLYSFGMSFVAVPIWLSLCYYATSRCLGLNSVWEVAFAALVSAVSVVGVCLLDIAYVWLYDQAAASWTGLMAYALVTAALGVVAVCFYRPRRVPAAALESCKARSNVLRIPGHDVHHTEI